MNIRYALTMLALGLAAVSPIRAEQEAMPLPTDTRLVQFVYDQNNTYTILGRPGDVTDVQLQAEEKLVAMALGDTVQWTVAKIPGHIFVRPIRDKAVTSATIVTDRRTYQLTLRAGPSDGRWYQQVAWSYPDMVVLRAEEARATATATEADAGASSKKNAPKGAGPNDIDIDQLNFDYTIEGSAPFKPTQVFDDGKFTWVRIPSASQEMPAVFIVTDNDVELGNFVVKGNYLVVQRLATAILLKLGKDEIRIKSNRAPGGKGSGLALSKLWGGN